MTTNETTHSHRVPEPGVWAPAITFFDHSTDTLDLASQKTWYTYLSKTGLRGLVILGTNAETFLLTREERATLLKLARSSVGPNYPLMAGVGGHSTKQVLEYISDATEAGMDYALVLPPAYFGKQTTAGVINRFYDEVAAKSPIPIVIYNFPGVCNGVDIDSETMAALAHKHANIVGVKLTCASVGKVVRLAATFPPSRFAVFGGQSDFLLGAMGSGAVGCIAAFANVFPKTLVKIYDLWTAGQTEEALKLHQKAALAESPCKAGIASTKYAAAIHSAKLAGIEGAEEKLRPRSPYEPPTEAVCKQIREVMKTVAAIEESL